MATSPRRALSLPTKINLVFGLASLLVLTVFITLELQSLRNSIREEVSASNRIATQLLARVSEAYARGGLAALTDFLQKTGRVRANEVRLFDNDGKLLYQSPPPTYKAGRDAPRWFAALVTPRIEETVINVYAGRMVITANPSRAVLDGWDDLYLFVFSQMTLMALAFLLFSRMLVHWLAPFEEIRQGLLSIAAGNHAVRLPELPGREPGEMGRAFNRMAQAVQDNLLSRHETALAQARLAGQREFTQALHARIEKERNEIARELHDEMGQSLTAIRSIAAALMHNPDIKDKPAEQSMRLLFDTAGGTFDAMQRLIPRLRPLQLEQIGLVDALRDLASSMALVHPGLRIGLQFDDALPTLDAMLEICIYRIVQEALTNVVRHAGADRAEIGLRSEAGRIVLQIDDNGCGLPDPDVAQRRYGIRGMRERADAFHGELQLATGPLGGLRVEAVFPLQEVAA